MLQPPQKFNHMNVWSHLISSIYVLSFGAELGNQVWHYFFLIMYPIFPDLEDEDETHYYWMFMTWMPIGFWYAGLKCVVYYYCQLCKDEDPKDSDCDCDSDSDSDSDC